MSIWKLVKKIINKGDSNSNQNQSSTIPISSNLEANLSDIGNELGNSSDIVVRKITLGDKAIPAAIIYTDGLVSNIQVNNFLESLLTRFPEKSNQSTIKILKDRLLNIGDVIEINDKKEIISNILTGSTAILVDNEKTALIASTKGWNSRNVSEPTNQTVLRGPREGFVENIRTNTALVRRIISSSKLRLEEMKIGTLTETTVGIMYIEGIAHPKIIKEVKRRLQKIQTDSVLGTGYLEEFIQDAPWSIFPTVAYAERPDIVAGNLLEGKITIILDGTPFVLIVPVTFMMFFQTADDYYFRSIMGSLLRLLRMGSYFISMTLPSLYVAVTTFHQELLPTTLLISLASQREGIPFPAFVEALLMEITFEILREAGVRMPRSIGSAVSIVGALVLGTAAVEAGIVSAVMVVIVSMTAISSLTAPYIDLAVTARIIRFILLLFAASFGLIGILFSFMIIAIHLTTIRSFGIPYMSGLAPFNLSDQKDIFVRLPWFFMKKRPRLFGQQNPIRQDTNIPHPPKPRQRKGKDE